MDFRRRISRQRSSRVEDIAVPTFTHRTHRRQRSDWSSIPRWPAWAQITLVLGLTGLLWFAKWLFITRDNNLQDVNLWLKNNGLQEHQQLFRKSGGCQSCTHTHAHRQTHTHTDTHTHTIFGGRDRLSEVQGFKTMHFWSKKRWIEKHPTPALGPNLPFAQILSRNEKPNEERLCWFSLSWHS